MRATDYARRLYKHIDLSIPPIELAPILEALNITVQPAELHGINGIIQGTQEWAIILVSQSDSLARKRWTIAHEIAHRVIPWHEGDKLRNGRKSITERESDHFAAELLMPIPLVKEWWERCRRRGREKAIEQMAWDFQVSRQAMEIRLRELGIIEVI